MVTCSPQILMIEDDEQDVQIVKELLYAQSNSVKLEHRQTLSTGITCLNETDSIDLVLLDLSLSDAEGLDTFHRVHRMFPSIPLVILSGNTDETIAIKALKEGAQDFLIKGRFNSSLLSRTINYALERQKLQLELQYKNAALRALSEKLEHTNQELEQLASLDGLTRVYNRRQFDSVFQIEWNRLCRDEKPLSIIFCDVDHFKAYNDTHGHPAGDQCLQRIAQAINQVVKRPADCVFRYGGEEFVVLLPHTDLSGAAHVAESIRSEVTRLGLPHDASPISNHVSLSLGVASLIPNEQIPPSKLIEKADQALYSAKDLGRNRVVAYSAESTYPVGHRSSSAIWTHRIQHALENNAFRLYAQPIQPLHQGQNRHYFEILLRLCDQPGIAIAPGLFLPIAEQNDYMNRIDQWVIEHLFADLKVIQENMQQNAQFFINLSTRSCQNIDFIQFIKKQLVRYDLPPQEFCFEFSESIAIKHVAKAIQLSTELKDIGCQVALNDFGHRLSLLRQHSSIAADYAKIDSSLISETATDPVSLEIVGTIHRLAQSMGMKTIAEYVESKKVLNSISENGIDYAQGFYFSQPRPLIETLVMSQLFPYR